MGRTAIIISVVVLSIFSQVSLVHSQEMLPRIDFEDIRNHPGVSDWDYLNITNSKSKIFSRNKDTLVLSCEAEYPIEWNITGKIVPVEFVKIQPYVRKIINKTQEVFHARLIIFFNPIDKPCYSSSLVSCQKVSHPEINSYYEVYVSGDKPLLNSGAKLIIKDSKLLPCPTTDPNVPVKLFRKTTNGTLESVNNLKYSELEGFQQLGNPVEGEFFCSTGSDDNVTILSTVSSGSGTIPKSEILKAFTSNGLSSDSEIIQLICSAEMINETVNYVFESETDSKVNFNITEQSSNKQWIRFSVSSPSPINITLKCFGNASLQTTEYWQLEFVDSPQLYLDNFEGEVDCLSNNNDKSVSTVRCINPSHCEYMKQCFDNSTFCNFKKQKYFYSNFNTHCWIESEKHGVACASVPYYHLNGIAQCTVAGLKRYWEYFVALSNKRYTNWQDASTADLIRIEHTYTGNTSVFLCEAVAYLFADSLKFSFEFENATTLMLDETLYTNPGIENPRKIDEFNVLGQLITVLPKDVVAVKCHAPFWNSTNYLTTTSISKKIGC